MLLAIVAAFSLAVVSTQGQATGLIGGYNARTDVDDYLKKDLIQRQLENIMRNEECDSLEEGRKFYFDLGQNDTNFPDGGSYLRSIPTYDDKISAEWREYFEWAGDNIYFHKKWVTKAFNKENLDIGNMKADFTNGTAFPYDPFQSGQCVGFAECVEKATSYVFNFIEVVQLMQAAIESAEGGCVNQQDDCEESLKFWDAAVAIYVGSLEGEKGRENPRNGKSLYALADKRCRNFKNCGPRRNEGNSKFRTSPINTKVLAYFAAGQHAAYAGDYALMEDFKKIISAKIGVPFIQGTLRFAWRLSAERSREFNSPFTNTDPLDKNGDENIDPKLSDDPMIDIDYSELDREVGQAAGFALGAVPKLWACSRNAGQLVWPQLAPGGGVAGRGPINFQLVKLAFECNYKCLLTSCREVGSLYDGVDNQGLIRDDDTDEFIDAEVDIRNGARTCNDDQFGTDPKGYAKCNNIRRSIRNGKCKFFLGKPGVDNSGRGKLKYFAETIPENA